VARISSSLLAFLVRLMRFKINRESLNKDKQTRNGKDRRNYVSS
jgi:hypothetical protein